MKDSAYNELDRILEKRGQRILEKFGQIIISGVHDPKFIAILNDVKSYWKDFFRPTLTSLSCEAVGGKPELADEASLLFTIASAGFGIHDDVLDRSLQKHFGRKTIMGKHGIDSALLVGDFLIVKAWTMVHEMLLKPGNSTKISDIIKAYGNFSVEICEAEFMESLCRRNLETDIRYHKNILWKAMAEVAACTKIGAIMGDGKSKEVEALAEYGRRLGFISRLADEMEDCLNLKGDLLHRIQYESVPLPMLYAAKSSRDARTKIRIIIEKTQLTTEDVKTLLKCYNDTNAFEYVRKIARKKKGEAANWLHLLKPNKLESARNARNILSAMNEKAYNRVAFLRILSLLR